jgi:hypothetical protein
MKLFTAFKSTFREDFSIDHHQKIVLLGSCFSENMQLHFSNEGFECESNPFGIIYNPVSIAMLLKKISQNQGFSESEILESSSGFTSFLTHSSFMFESKTALNDALKHNGNRINSNKKPTTFIITLGSAWVYKLNNTGIICANCHKKPKSTFTKELLSFETIEQSLKDIAKHIELLNPKNKVIFTLSPVRHLKDGFVENQHSKSLLHAAIQTHCGHNKYLYFPSYEIMMDELRDYRFYKEDLIHPNAVAIQLIWNYFTDTFFKAETKNISMKVLNYIQFKNHKVLSKQVNESLKHAEAVSKNRESLLSSYPYLNLPS